MGQNFATGEVDESELLDELEMLDQEADLDDLADLDLPAAGVKDDPAPMPAKPVAPAAAKASDEQELADLMNWSRNWIIKWNKNIFPN